MREAKEELNITINPNDVTIVHCMQHKTDKQTMQFYVACTKFQGTSGIMPETKHGQVVYEADKIGWFSADNLPEDIIPSARQAIFSYVKGRPFSQLGY